MKQVTKSILYEQYRISSGVKSRKHLGIIRRVNVIVLY